jgi:hypothetical protein
VLGFSSRSRGELIMHGGGGAGWSGRGHLDSDEAAGGRPWRGSGARRCGVEWNGIFSGELEGLPNLELWPRSVRWRVAVSSTVM